jgi:cytochrome P450
VPQPGFKNPFSYISPSGLLIIEGQTWKRHRKLAQLAFLPNSLRHVLRVTNQMMDKAINKWGSNLGAERELHSELSAFTLDVVAATSFSVDLNSFEDVTSHSSYQPQGFYLPFLQRDPLLLHSRVPFLIEMSSNWYFLMIIAHR